MVEPSTHIDGKVTLYGGDNRDALRQLPDNSIDSIVTDPPYALVSIVKRFGAANAAGVKVPEGGSGADARASAGFMGKAWDTGEVAFSEVFWAECMRVLKPGGHVVAFSGTRTYHRMAVAIEDAGFEIRDQLAWVYGSGFPKSHDVSKGIDKAAGAERMVVGRAKRTGKEAGTYGAMAGDNILTAPATPAAREWQGWGTALKPSWEPICMARKPLSEKTVAANVLKWGTGALNVDGCRVGDNEGWHGRESLSGNLDKPIAATAGRWPANLVHDGSDEVVACFPVSKDGVAVQRNRDGAIHNEVYGEYRKPAAADVGYGSSGSAARFFYSAKADKQDRIGSKHPTVKPVDLMQWLCRLVTPPGGTVLDPFAGSGSTGEAAWREGFKAILCEREEEYQADIAERLRLANAGPMERKARAIKQVSSAGPLFAPANDTTLTKAAA